MTDFTPPYTVLDPFNQEFIDVGEGHAMNFIQSGNKEGDPIIILHGGPGAQISNGMRALFNPEKFHIIQYDQRGCGLSTPKGSLENNTTDHLIKDICFLLEHLSLEKAHIYGGSWGSTLALAFASKHPDKVKSLTIQGIFLGSDSELEDVYYAGGVASKVFTDAFQDYFSVLSQEERKSPIESYRQYFLSDDKEIRDRAVKSWTKYESILCMLVADHKMINEFLSDTDALLPHALFETHYFVNHCFIDVDYVLKELSRLNDNVKVNIIQGRYDMICPFETAWQVHKTIKHSILHVVNASGHHSAESGIAQKIVQVLDAL